MNFHIESWNALAPGLDNREDWRRWLRQPLPIDEQLGKVALDDIPALLRRRFSTLGKCAMGAALPLLEDVDHIPSIFASRHGDTQLSFSLLRQIGLREQISPANFSLAVHNAVSGLFTIARRDTSEVITIAAMGGLVLPTVFEAIGQLQDSERVLCVIYDIPLQEFFEQHTSESEISFPYAIAMILCRESGQAFSLESNAATARSGSTTGETDTMHLLTLLTGLSTEILLSHNRCVWRVSRIAN